MDSFTPDHPASAMFPSNNGSSQTPS